MSDHPECGLLDEYVLGTLDRRDALRVAEHLKTCAACRCEYDELRSVIDVLPLALPSSAPPTALRERILAATDVPRTRFSAVAIARGLAAALLIALAGDVFFAVRFGPGRRVVAVATPMPAGTAAAPRAAGTPAASHVEATGVPTFIANKTRTVSSASAGVSAKATERATRDAETIARLKHEIALVQQQSRFDRRRLHELEGQLARARALPRQVAVVPTSVATAVPTSVAVAPSTSAATAKPTSLTIAAPTSLPVEKPTPSAPAGEAAAPGPRDGALVTALRSGKVYAIDGSVDGESWHLTILQPRAGERAVIYSGTPDAPSGQTYRTWVLRDGRTVNVGELVPGKPATLEMPMALEPGDVVAFSREPIGTGDLPTQPFLMQLKISQ